MQVNESSGKKLISESRRTTLERMMPFNLTLDIDLSPYVRYRNSLDMGFNHQGNIGPDFWADVILDDFIK